MRCTVLHLRYSVIVWKQPLLYQLLLCFKYLCCLNPITFSTVFSILSSLCHKRRYQYAGPDIFETFHTRPIVVGTFDQTDVFNLDETYLILGRYIYLPRITCPRVWEMRHISLRIRMSVGTLYLTSRSSFSRVSRQILEDTKYYLKIWTTMNLLYWYESVSFILFYFYQWLKAYPIPSGLIILNYSNRRLFSDICECRFWNSQDSFRCLSKGPVVLRSG